MRTVKPESMKQTPGMQHPSRWAKGMTRKRSKSFPITLRLLADKIETGPWSDRRSICSKLRDVADDITNVNASVSRSLPRRLVESVVLESSSRTLKMARVFWSLPQSLRRLAVDIARSGEVSQARVGPISKALREYAKFLQSPKARLEDRSTPLADVKRAELEVRNMFLEPSGRWMEGEVALFGRLEPIFQATWQISCPKPLISFKPAAIRARLASAEPFPTPPEGPDGS
jgi:hypothetical protein